ncbi:VOC family protein [Afifella sp. IM 167]|uniref:VOC family protein n=1 Tax=Afifella sp. IM 167 TaxID=2033586 RepID=UPI001CCDFF0E|nr:VOC family protein [Afifella sp. IM 167]MBZ8132339.1 lactoylglutathione lyase [Afifella sp. IM 167]
MRPIDHLVLPVSDLAAARRRLTGLGFQVSPDARHPFGTGNARVFFKNRTYLEPITPIDRHAFDTGISEGLVFLKRLKRGRARAPESFVMLALKTDDAAEDLQRYRKAGFAEGELFSFVGRARDDDGAEQDYGVRLAFAGDEHAPEAGIFACEPVGMTLNDGTNYADHPNGAEGVVAVVLVAKNPADFHIFLSAATGQRELRSNSFLVELDLGAQKLIAMTPQGFRARYGIAAPDPDKGLLFAGFEVAVDDLETARSYAPQARLHEGRIVVPPAPGLGTVLAFVETT